MNKTPKPSFINLPEYIQVCHHASQLYFFEKGHKDHVHYYSDSEYTIKNRRNDVRITVTMNENGYPVITTTVVSGLNVADLMSVRVPIKSTIVGSVIELIEQLRRTIDEYYFTHDTRQFVKINKVNAKQCRPNELNDNEVGYYVIDHAQPLHNPKDHYDVMYRIHMSKNGRDGIEVDIQCKFPPQRGYYFIYNNTPSLLHRVLSTVVAKSFLNFIQ